MESEQNHGDHTLSTSLLA